MTREELKRLMKAKKVSRSDMANKLLVSEHTVRSWLLPPTSKGSRTITPPMASLIRKVLE